MEIHEVHHYLSVHFSEHIYSTSLSHYLIRLVVTVRKSSASITALMKVGVLSYFMFCLVF